jgi:hypothetical protein
MKLPIQSAPVERTIPTASVSNAPGVEASDILDDIAKGIGLATQAITPFIPLLGSLI